MKNPKINIFKFLMINRIIVIGLVSAFLLASIIFGISISSLYKKQLNTVLVINNEGEVIPMKWLNRLDNIKIEIKNHLLMFHDNFYEYDSFNWEKNSEKALWLGDDSVEQLFIKRSNDGWYNRVEMYNVKQKIEINPEDIQIKGNDEPFAFKLNALLTINQSGSVTKYQFQTSGNIVFVSRNFPLNPHGLLITNFNEINRTKIQ